MLVALPAVLGDGAFAAGRSEGDAVLGAVVSALAVDRARGERHDRGALRGRETTRQFGATHVDAAIAVDLVHRLPGAGLGSEVHDRVDVGQALPGALVGHVPDDDLAGEGGLARLRVEVDLTEEVVKGDELVAIGDEAAGEVLADEAGTPGDEDLHCVPSWAWVMATIVAA